MDSSQNLEVVHLVSQIMGDSFQICDPLVLAARQQDNIRVKLRDSTKPLIAVYFSSHAIYFPNDAATFRREILEHDRYEWTDPRNDFQQAGINLYTRDLFKQWYIDGITAKVDSVEQLADMLREYIGDRPVITVGTSAGGYAATLFGVLLGAQAVYTFSSQFDLERAALYEGGQRTNPLIWRYRSVPEKAQFYRLGNWIENAKSVPVLYFYGTESLEDCVQYDTVKHCANLFAFPIRSPSHGIVVYPFDLSAIFAQPLPVLLAHSERLVVRPLTKTQFSIRLFGLRHFARNFARKAIHVWRAKCISR